MKMKTSATRLPNFARSLVIFFRLLTLGDAESDESQEKRFYCDDSSDAMSFVPASRTCTNLAGQERCWFTYVPEEDEQETIPLVLDLHGFGGCAQFTSDYTGWKERAYDDNFAVIWPQGTNNIFYSLLPCWDAGSCCCTGRRDIPDSDFLMEIIQKTINASNGKIDPKRVYIGGHSNGCFMSQRFVKDYPGVVAAVACHAGVMLLEHPSNDDPNWVPTTIVTVHGDADDTVSYPTTPGDLGAEDNIDLWGESNGCTKKEITPNPSNDYVTHTWTECDGGVSSQLIQVLGAGHSPYASDGYVDTTSIAWDYIKTVSLDPGCPGNGIYSTIVITTDQNPSETSWTVARGSVDNIVLVSDPYVEQNFNYSVGLCAVPDCYIFTIKDSSGDGLSGDGGYAIYADGNLLSEGSFNDGFEESVQIGC